MGNGTYKSCKKKIVAILAIVFLAISIILGILLSKVIPKKSMRRFTV